MNDLIVIYRKDAKDAIRSLHIDGEEYREYNHGLYAARTILDDVLPAEKTREWIPVSEMMPEKFGEVIVTFVPAAGTLWTKVIIAHYSDLMGIAKPCFWIGEVGKESFCDITKQVVAWMPKPKAYNCGARTVEE